MSHRSLIQLVAICVAAFGVSHLAIAFPTGSPVCTTTIEEMNRRMGQQPEENPDGWRIEASSVTYSPGGATFDVRIAHPDNRTFKGVLLWAVDSDNAQVGTWQNIPAAFKAADGCSGKSLTHNSNNPKSSPSVYFQLALPIEVRGQVTVKAFVVQERIEELNLSAHYEIVSSHVHLDATRNDLDVDTSRAPSRYHALTDGILVVRYLLGLRGTSLTTGAKGSTALRTDSEIETQIEFLRTSGALNVDGDAQTLPETDGLLIVRYLLGYRGQALVQGVNGGALDSSIVETRIGALLP
jgi:Reeler domain